MGISEAARSSEAFAQGHAESREVMKNALERGHTIMGGGPAQRP